MKFIIYLDTYGDKYSNIIQTNNAEKANAIIQHYKNTHSFAICSIDKITNNEVIINCFEAI